MADPFTTLRVGYDADTGQLKAAYRERARNLHPDAGGDANQFVLLTDAYARAKAIRIGQRWQPQTPPTEATATHQAIRATPTDAPANLTKDWLAELQSWFRPWVLIGLAIQVLALSVVALGQPARPGLAVAAALLLDPLAATAVYLTAVLAGAHLQRPSRPSRQSAP